MADLEAVIFDWGGTLTPWKSVDYSEEWRSLARVAAPDDVEGAATRLLEASVAVWARSQADHRSGTLREILDSAGVPYDEEHLGAYRDFWEHATFTDPDAAPVFTTLRASGLRVGVLSNTVWPGDWHADIFRRDGVDHLIDGAVYTSEIPWTKPAPEAFAAAIEAVGIGDPTACVYVGDRLFEDVWGAGQAGMRTIFVPHSDIPADQLGHSEGEPDATVHRLAEVVDVIRSWRGSD